METSIGRLLLAEALPEDLRDDIQTLDAKGIQALMRRVAEKHPDQYKSVLQKLNDIGRQAAWNEGTSVSLQALRRSPVKEQILAQAKGQLQQIINDPKLNDQQRQDSIVNALLPLSSKLQDGLVDEAKRENNPFYLQLVSGARGKKSDFNSLRGADLLVQDQNDKILPIPIMRSYSDGLDPVEYFAGLYGQRKGMVGVKFATADAGFLSKQLIAAAHRLVVNREAPEATRLPVGLPVNPNEKDNVGAVLALPVKLGASGEIAAGTTLSASQLKAMEDAGIDEIVIHSPMTEPSEDGGISRFAAGRRDRFDLSRIGDNIGISSAQAIGEKLSQGMLSSKHSSGVVKVGHGRSGFEYLNRLIQAPETFPDAGPLAPEDGIVNAVEPASQGGSYVTVGKQRLYVHPDLKVTAKVGDTVEEGDDLTDGVPHPRELVKHRGIGEARRVYTGMLKEALENSGLSTHRRNLETVVAGLINWTQVTDPDGVGDNLLDDVAAYNRLAYHYRPRDTAKLSPVRQSLGRFLEEPALHYSIGTRVTKRVADQLERHGIKDLQTHEEAPGFQPYMQRGLLGVHEDEDWQTQQVGFYTVSAFEKSVARGAESNPNSTSFVPALARGDDFGKNLAQTGTYGQAPLPKPKAPMPSALPQVKAPFDPK